jgi:hypothetical protein
METSANSQFLRPPVLMLVRRRMNLQDREVTRGSKQSGIPAESLKPDAMLPGFLE